MQNDQTKFYAEENLTRHWYFRKGLLFLRQVLGDKNCNRDPKTTVETACEHKILNSKDF